MSNIANKEKFCHEMLLGLLGSEKLIEAWWNSPNKGFEGKAPKDVFKENPDTVIKYLYQFI